MNRTCWCCRNEQRESVSDFEEERDYSCAFFPLLFITKTCEKKVVSFGKPPCVARESVAIRRVRDIRVYVYREL